jgi:hypothetical protein
MTKIFKFTYFMILLFFLFLFITTNAGKSFFSLKVFFYLMHNFSTFFNNRILLLFYITEDGCITFLDCLHVHCLPTQTQLCVMNKCECMHLTVKSKNNSIF